MYSTAELILGHVKYKSYKKIVYYEMWIIFDNKENFIQLESISNEDKINRVSEICDFLYLDKDMENFNKLDNILKILEIKKNIHSN
jgi:hypothetical protein